MAREPVRLGVLISGRGTNLQAIIDAIERGGLRGEIRVVISNRSNAEGLERARKHRIDTHVIRNRDYSSREDFDRALVQVLNANGAELVACAGFMRLLSQVMIDEFPNRIMNIHPSLLPAFPGLNAQKAALEHGVRITGCTVFFVGAGIDDGPIIAQASTPVTPLDDEESLSNRILIQEHRIYPEAIRLYQEGKLEVRGRKVIIADSPPPEHSAMANPAPR